MDSVLQAQFERMEKALSTLVDSIASFNPSPQAAFDLVAADDELSSGLDQLSQHQANHARILTLRSEAEALEAQLRSSISTLSSLRHELLETPATTFPEDSRPVAVRDLLQYAANISAYTVPPLFRETKLRGASNNEKDGEDATPSEIPTNGLPTPALPGPSAAGEGGTTAVVEGQAEENKEGAPEQAEWLAKMREKNIHWVPWPNDDKIRTGNLMAIQHLLDQKRDPWTEAVPTKQELDDALKREKDAQEQAEAQARAQALAVREETARREPMVPTQAREPEQARPQFKGFEFDEDD